MEFLGDRGVTVSALLYDPKYVSQVAEPVCILECSTSFDIVNLVSCC